MLIHKTGDILQATENIICHQVNVDGVMGGGLAKQIASTYPNVKKQYQKYCKEFNNDYQNLKGRMLEVLIKDNQSICNCFTQRPNFDTDYEAIEQGFNQLLMNCAYQGKTLCIAFKYGCGIANGDWDKVSKVFEGLSTKYNVDISVYRLENENE